MKQLSIFLKKEWNINERLNDLREGKIYSNEEAQRIFQEWKKK